MCKGGQATGGLACHPKWVENQQACLNGPPLDESLALLTKKKQTAEKGRQDLHPDQQWACPVQPTRIGRRNEVQPEMRNEIWPARRNGDEGM